MSALRQTGAAQYATLQQSGLDPSMLRITAEPTIAASSAAGLIVVIISGCQGCRPPIKVGPPPTPMDDLPEDPGPQPADDEDDQAGEEQDIEDEIDDDADDEVD